MKEHAADCTIYSLMDNGRPEDGICTCGYGWYLVTNGDRSQMYSKERLRNDKTLSIQLKDCPFCGGNPVIYSDGDGPMNGRAVVCPGCGAKTQVNLDKPDDGILKWNMRQERP